VKSPLLRPSGCAIHSIPRQTTPFHRLSPPLPLDTIIRSAPTHARQCTPALHRGFGSRTDSAVSCDRAIPRFHPPDTEDTIRRSYSYSPRFASESFVHSTRKPPRAVMISYFSSAQYFIELPSFIPNPLSFFLTPGSSDSTPPPRVSMRRSLREAHLPLVMWPLGSHRH